MSDFSDPLATLRDTRLPATSEAAFFADLALGGVIGLGLMLVLLLVINLFWDGQQSFRRHILSDLDASRALPKPERLLAQIKILRRLARQHGLPIKIDWLSRVDEITRQHVFATEANHPITTEIFRREPQIDPDKLDESIHDLIRRLKG